MSPFTEGKEAFENGVGIGSNPYNSKANSGACQQWRLGWTEAYWQANDSSQGGE